MTRRSPFILLTTLCCLLAVATSAFAQAVNTSPKDILANPQAIRVFSFGTAPCRVGGATVEGSFEKVKRQGRYTFYNEVTATRVLCR
jgi:hypothetical protein